jgi:uncharacterized protein YicC (UPF0701 family)
MEEIILKAKAGPPVSRLVGNHVEVTKALENASIVEKHTKRRITGKQSLNATMVRRELLATVKAAKEKTKAEGKKLMKQAVDGLMEQANTHGKNLKADFHRQMKTLTNELVELKYDPAHERADREEQIVRLNQVLALLRANGVIA